MSRALPPTRRFPILPVVSTALVVAVAVLVLAFILSRVEDEQHRGGPLRDASQPSGAEPINTAVEGLTTFRGNATRSYYGEGPVPLDPVIGWRTPAERMCSVSFVGIESSEWCGTGWTGQPNVVVGEDGRIEVREGAYDGQYHFLDGLTGVPVRPALATRDLAKGSATSDPDGFPLYYAGSRDGRFRIVATDRQDPLVLWSIHGATSVDPPLRNDDWDGAALVVDDVLFVGGENGWLYAIRLNRGYDELGLVTVAPEVVATVPGWDDELLRVLGDDEVSIENSVALHDGVLYFANSGGLVQGWDVRDVLGGGSGLERVFRFWTGDDTDATISIDGAGDLYVASEYQRLGERSREVGQLMKLDPSRPADPLVWSIDAREIGFEGAGGSWSTPALYGDLVFFTTAAGRVLAVERETGDVRWERRVGAPAIGSPVVVDGVLIQGDCAGDLWAWDVSDPDADPVLLWKLHFSDCIESTPAVWRGWIYLGTRQGYLYGLTHKGTVEAGP
ncbi:MAG TPA: PQQ-binding-like beta-propeller repeat protein [Actinomycetota bacterium]|nr:PQQ-binding-like beta-propeller repeat protein [Actinomycetota bacterium]